MSEWSDIKILLNDIYRELEEDYKLSIDTIDKLRSIFEEERRLLKDRRLMKEISNYIRSFK